MDNYIFTRELSLPRSPPVRIPIIRVREEDINWHMDLPINVWSPVRTTTGEYLSVYLYAKKETYLPNLHHWQPTSSWKPAHRLSKVRTSLGSVGNYYCRLSSQWERTRRDGREFCLHIAISQRLVAREPTRRTMSPLTRSTMVEIVPSRTTRHVGGIRVMTRMEARIASDF